MKNDIGELLDVDTLFPCFEALSCITSTLECSNVDTTFVRGLRYSSRMHGVIGSKFEIEHSLKFVIDNIQYELVCYLSLTVMFFLDFCMFYLSV